MCRTTESGPGYFLCLEDWLHCTGCTALMWQPGLSGYFSFSSIVSAKKQGTPNGRPTPGHPRQTIPEAPDRRSDDRSSRPWTRNLSAPLRYAKRPHRSCAIRYGVWGPLALITSPRTIFSPTYWTPLYFSHSVANVFAHCIPFKKQRSRAPFFQHVTQQRLRQEKETKPEPNKYSIRIAGAESTASASASGSG